MKYPFIDFCNLIRSKENSELIIYTLQDFDNYEEFNQGGSYWCYAGARFADKEEGELYINNRIEIAKSRPNIVPNSYRLVENKIKVTEDNRIYGTDLSAEEVLDILKYFLEESDFITYCKDHV